ncbi:MAG TPA: transglutaminase-like domain-containing protein [Candidatus Xenobia bacterium]|jgi:hypothetical protein
MRWKLPLLVATVALACSSLTPPQAGAMPFFHHRHAASPTPTPTPTPSPTEGPTGSPSPTPVPTPTPSSPSPKPLASPTPPPPSDSDLKGLRLPVGSEATYQISWMGQPIGFSQFEIGRQLELGGESFYVINSTCRVKAGRGTIQDTVWRNKLIMSAANFKPSYYYTAMSRGHGEPLITEALFSKTTIAETNMVGKHNIQFAYDVDVAPWLFDQNLWGRFDAFAEHYLILGLVAQASHKAIPAYDPVLQGGGRIEMSAPTHTTVKGVPANVFTLSDMHGSPLVRVAVQVGQPRLLYVQEVGGGFRFDLAGPSVVAASNRWPGADLSRAQALASKIYFADPDSLREMKLTIKAQVRNPALLNHQIPGFTQTFSGQVAANGAVDGTITVETSPRTVSGQVGHPLADSDLAGLGDTRWLRPELGIESEVPSIRNKSLELTWKVDTAWEAVRRIVEWVHANVKPGPYLPSARLILAAQQGGAEAKALLTAALCRSAGIPARVLGGLYFEQGNFVPHSWNEVYLGPEGWVAVDADTGEVGTLSACHVAMWDRGDLVSGSLTVADYAPKPDRKVAYYNRDITWPVGEQRTFSLRRGDKVVGQETAWLEMSETPDGDDQYRFVSKVDVSDGSQKASGQSQVTLSADALPMKADYQGNLSPELPGETVLFDKTDIVTKVGGDHPKTQQIPYSKGVYLADGRFLSQLALVLGQTPNLKAGRKLSVWLFRPDTLTIRKEELDVKGEEVLVKGADSWETWRCEASDGLVVNIDKDSHQVQKIVDGRTGYELDYEQSKLRL